MSGFTPDVLPSSPGISPADIPGVDPQVLPDIVSDEGDDRAPDGTGGGMVHPTDPESGEPES